MLLMWREISSSRPAGTTHSPGVPILKLKKDYVLSQTACQCLKEVYGARGLCISRKVSAKPDSRVDAPSQLSDDLVSGLEYIAESHRVILVRLIAYDVFFFDLLMLGNDLDCAFGNGPHLTRGVFRGGDLGRESLKWS